MAKQTKSCLTEMVIRINSDEYPEIEDDYFEEEKTPISTDEEQEKSDIPLPPVTFYFVGIRPAKSHQTVSKVHGVTAVQIKFDKLTLNDTVSTFKKSICGQFGVSEGRSILIMFGNIKLNKDEEKLKDYGITDGSYFLLAIYDNINTQHRDIQICEIAENEEILSRREREQKRRERDMNAVKKRLQRINGNISSNDQTLKKVPCPKPKESALSIKHFLKKLDIQSIKALDIVTQEKDANCLKMPVCGHPLSQTSLYEFTLSQYKNRERMICCPHSKNNGVDHKLCLQPFDYPIIKQYLLTKTDEKESDVSDNFNFAELELLSARNVIEIDYDLQKCIECKTLLYRNQKDNNFTVRTECPLCSSSVFCWGCNEKWSDGHICDTSFKAQTMEIISKCDTKQIGNVKKVPSIRCCPKCNQLINHRSACKHMKCSFCKTDFCFVCLKMKKKTSWQCGGSSDRCPIHKRQNYAMLPKLNQTSFEIY